MKNVLYPLTYLGLCPFLIVLGRALQTQYSLTPTYVAVTPAEAAFAKKNVPAEHLVYGLGQEWSQAEDVLENDAQYEAVYGFMKNKYGGSGLVWRQRVNTIYRLIEQLVRERQIDLIVLWNGNDCVGKVCQIIAGRHGLKTLFLENGYFPDTLQIDPVGVNAEASVAGVPATEWLGLNVQPAADVPGDAPIAPTATSGLSAFDRMWLKLRQVVDRNFFDCYPELRDQLVRKQVRTALELSSTAAVLADKTPFALVVLQVHDDTQILLNSRLFGSPAEFLQHCYQSIRQVLGPFYRVVVKLHPADMGRICYSDIAETMQGVSWIGAEPVEPLLQECAFVMVINSSVGLQSIALHKPTLVFGESFYSRSEICHVVRKLDDTRVFLRALDQGNAQVDTDAIEGFLAYLHRRYFVKGSWKLGPQADLRPVVERIHKLLASPSL